MVIENMFEFIITCEMIQNIRLKLEFHVVSHLSKMYEEIQ